MSTQGEIMVSVNKLLEEIEGLKVSRDEAEGDPTKVTYFRCVIFQKFAVIDSLLRFGSGAREVVKEQVARKRKELRAEIEDLKGLLIPRSLEAKTVEGWKSDRKNESFPAYLSLPPEVRQFILGYLTSPSDKMNLAKAIPWDGDMMGWSANSLRLELVLGLVYEQDRKRRLGYKEALNLCLASADLADVVKNCFERTLAHSSVQVPGKNYVGDCVTYATAVGNVSKEATNPLPATIFLGHDFEDEDSEDEDEFHDWKSRQMECLRRIGENVWSFDLAIHSASSSREMLLLLRDCLELLPNLRNLAVFIDLQKEESNTENLEEIQLPELAHLQVLELKGYETATIYKKLLEKCRSRVKRLVIRSPSCLPVFPVGQVAYPWLTHLDLQDSGETEDFDWDPLDIVMKLEGFEGSRLKSLRVSGGYATNNAQGFINVLTAIARFGETLECLSVEFAFNKLPSEDDEEVELVKLVDLEFPKVKTLEVGCYPRTWTFLLGFPVLEHLTLDILSDEDSFFEAPSAIAGWSEMNLSLVKEELYTSHIWKLLPFLKTVEATFGDLIKPFQVTRTQCRTFQRKLVEIKGRVGQADMTIKGSVESIEQPSDGSLVVEGDVKGDVVQEGNGCILVNGKVQGNIEQKGDGKIFVCGKHHGALVKTGNGVVKVDCGNVNN